MDPLSDVLQTIKLSGVIFLRANLRDRYGVEMPPATLSHPMLRPPTAEHRLVMFHIIAEGRGFVQVQGADPIRIEEGDLVLVFHDLVHSVVDRPGQETVPSASVPLIYAPVPVPPEVDLGEGPTTLRMVCGMLQFVERGISPIFSALPPYLHIRRDDGPSSRWLRVNLEHILREAESGRPGSEALLGRLTELMFVETLRTYLERLPETERGWLAALADPMVGRAIALLHAHPEHPWTVTELARRVAASRSALAARFTDLLDLPPIGYLTRWRIRLSTNLLEDTTLSVAEVASRVGYESESAFHRAFKREMGIPPVAWRRRTLGSAISGERDGPGTASAQDGSPPASTGPIGLASLRPLP